jgi:hypothetical protein
MKELLGENPPNICNFFWWMSHPPEKKDGAAKYILTSTPIWFADSCLELIQNVEPP